MPALQELKDYLRQGIQLDELWRVARGEIKLHDFKASASAGNGAALAEAPNATPVDIPKDLVCQSPNPTITDVALTRHRVLPDEETTESPRRCCCCSSPRPHLLYLTLLTISWNLSSADCRRTSKEGMWAENDAGKIREQIWEEPV